MRIPDDPILVPRFDSRKERPRTDGATEIGLGGPEFHLFQSSIGGGGFAGWSYRTGSAFPRADEIDRYLTAADPSVSIEC